MRRQMNDAAKVLLFCNTGKYFNRQFILFNSLIYKHMGIFIHRQFYFINST